MPDDRVLSALAHEPMNRRRFMGRTAAAGVAAWSIPTVLSTDPVAAAAGSCSDLSVCEFTTGLEGWTIDNSWGPGTTGLWKHNGEPSRDGGSLHYGRGTGGNYSTGTNSRNSGAIDSPEFVIPTTGPNTVRFSVWRQVETQDPGYDRLRLRVLGAPTQTIYQVTSIGDTVGFETLAIAIPATYWGDTVRFRFDFDTMDGLYNDYEGVYIGRFEVTACPPPGAGLALGARAASSFEIVDDEVDKPPPPRS